MSQPTSSQTEFTIEAFFRRLNQEGRITGARCTECGFKMVPPRPACSRCLASKLELFDLEREGELIGFSEVHVANDAFQSSVPYAVGIAEVGEVKIPGTIKGADVRKLRVGSRVRVEIRPPRSTASESPGSPAYWFEIV